MESHASIETALEQRLGVQLARHRLQIETKLEKRIFGKGLNFFHPENWYSLHAFLRYGLKLSGFFWLGQRNARRHRLHRVVWKYQKLPLEFNGFKLLHLSDLHADFDKISLQRLRDKISSLEFDICVLTGDYRAKTYGHYDKTLEAMAYLFQDMAQARYAVLGNHDTIRMVPGLEALGIQVLINEVAVLERNNTRIYIAGVDEPHFFRMDDIQSCALQIPKNAFSILLAHTPEIFSRAAEFNFNLMLCGHTHGGQICLPGQIPLTLDSKCPRWVGKGRWKFKALDGYTSRGAGCSIVNVRFNCPPEVTIHELVADD